MNRSCNFLVFGFWFRHKPFEYNEHLLHNITLQNIHFQLKILSFPCIQCLKRFVEHFTENSDFSLWSGFQPCIQNCWIELQTESEYSRKNISNSNWILLGTQSNPLELIKIIPFLETVAGEALSIFCGSNIILQVGDIFKRSPFASVNVLLSSKTEFKFSIQILSTGPSSTSQTYSSFGRCIELEHSYNASRT